MIINAKDKIISKIDELLPKNGAIFSKYYDSETTRELFYRLPYFFNIKELLKKHNRQGSQYVITAYFYGNGLIRLESDYCRNAEYVISQIVITDSLESGNAIINLWNKFEVKALQQFFIKSESPSSVFGLLHDNKRTIETNETEIEIENIVIDKFQKINKYNSNTMFAEKYMPINRISNGWDLMNKCDLMKKNISDTIELEILYDEDNKALFAQLFDNEGKSLLEDTSYHASDYRDARDLVCQVNREVDLILKKIISVLAEYGLTNDREQEKIILKKNN